MKKLTPTQITFLCNIARTSQDAFKDSEKAKMKTARLLVSMGYATETPRPYAPRDGIYENGAIFKVTHGGFCAALELSESDRHKDILRYAERELTRAKEELAKIEARANALKSIIAIYEVLS